MADNSKLHPALAVTNIKNYIPITLDKEKVVLYTPWVALFKIHCRVYEVLDHIIPPEEKPANVNDALWSRIDAVVLQWIYGTISNDLLLAIIAPDATAKQAWERLESIFQDNKNSRALQLENQFTRVRLDDFPNIAAYCQELKMIADQLSSVGAPVTNQRLVLQLIAGLNEKYDGVAKFILQSDHLPPFYEVRTKLIFEETHKAKQTAANANASGTALLTTNSESSDGGSSRSQTGQKRGKNHGGRGRGGHGGSNHQQQAPRPNAWQQQQQYPPLAAAYPPAWRSWALPQPWAALPCPYPTSTWARPQPPRQPGILGAQPQQAYSAHTSPPLPYVPTNSNEAAMRTMTLNAPDAYMDTGATSHVTTSTTSQGSSDEDDASATNEM